VWSGSLDPKIRSVHPVPLAIAESMSCMGDWPALAHFVENANWGQQEPLRFAVQSHALRHLGNQGSSAEAQTTWRSAIKAAQGQPNQLAAIAQLAQGWGYRAEAAEVLWAVANGTTGAKEALSGLQNFYKQTHDSRGLFRVAKRALELNPNDLVAANNCASLGLLLSADPGARRLAEKLYNDHPTNAAFAATYAFALHVEGKTADALRVIERLKDQQLRQPALAAYYVVMLAASGNIERARAFLPAAERANLLPEEKTLLADAARKLNASS
jgi:Flp pilus assembly protein TadD